MPRSHYSIAPLTADQARDIKRRLWYGERIASIIADLGCSRELVKAIIAGRRHYHVAWPDRTIGGLDPERSELIERARAQSEREFAPLIINRTKRILCIYRARQRIARRKARLEAKQPVQPQQEPTPNA